MTLAVPRLMAAPLLVRLENGGMVLLEYKPYNLAQREMAGQRRAVA